MWITYIYDGPVLYFDKCIALKWKGSTTASSKQKAISNLSYQFKKENNMAPNTKISLPGQIKIAV